MSDLAALLAFVEKHGSAVVPSRTLDAMVDVDARVALGAAKVLASAPAIATWPCEERGCSREIQSNGGARRPLVAVCSRARADCEPVELGFDDVAQQRIAVDALLVAACALYEMHVEGEALRTLRERQAIGAREPLLVAGAVRSRDRDLFWVGSPRDTDIAAFGARRERVKRKTRVLVPTMRHVPLDVASRYAHGEHVEIVALVDLIAVRDGKLALAEEAPTVGAAPTRKGQGIAAELGATKWEDIGFVLVDGHTLRIEAVAGAGVGAVLLRTFVELGFSDARKRDELVPIIGWSVLLLILRKGHLRPSEYAEFGKAYAVKKGVEVVRRLLKTAFGLKGDPFLPYRSDVGWAPRFRVKGSASKRS